MRNWIIKKLNGFSGEEVEIIKALNQKELKSAIKKTFRIGDPVYIVNESGFIEGNVYYLQESYNNGNHWYVSNKKVDSYRRELINGVGVMSLRHEKPTECSSCKSILRVDG